MHERATSARSDKRTVNIARTREHLMLEIARLLANAVEPDLFFDAVACGLRHFLQVDRTSLTLFDSERDQFELVALALQEESSLGRGSIIPHLGSRTGIAFDSRRPYVYALDARTSFFEDPPLVEEGLNFAAQVPIIADGTCMGTLNTDVRRHERLSEADVDLLCGIAGHIAIALATSGRHPNLGRSGLNRPNGFERRSASAARRPQSYCPVIRPSMRSSLDRIMAIAKSDAIVLLLGETGTGKGIIARTIHDWSARKNKPFVKCDCAALSSQLVESELFGHEKGAFTGAPAMPAASNKPMAGRCSSMRLRSCRLLIRRSYWEYCRIGRCTESAAMNRCRSTSEWLPPPIAKSKPKLRRAGFELISTTA